MTTKKKNPVPAVSIVHRNAQLMSVLYDLVENNREPTEADAEMLKYLYSGA